MERKIPGVDHERGAFTCLISSTSTGGQKTCGVVITDKQHQRQKKRGFATKKLILIIGAIMIGRQIVISVGQRGGAAIGTTLVPLKKFLRTSRCQRRWAHSIVGTRIDSKQLGWRVWVPQTAWFMSVLEEATSWCFLHPTQSYRPVSNRSKLPSWDMAPPGFRQLTQNPFHSFRDRATIRTRLWILSETCTYLRSELMTLPAPIQ